MHPDPFGKIKKFSFCLLEKRGYGFYVYKLFIHININLLNSKRNNHDEFEIERTINESGKLTIIIFKMDMLTFCYNYRVVSFSKLCLTALRIILQSLKSRGQF